MKKFISCVCIILFLTSSAYAKIYYADENITDINIKKGDKLIVKLNENPTTGYSWLFSVNQEKLNILKEISRTYIPDRPQLMGSGGKTNYKLKATKRGHATINGVYKRPWENNDGIYKYTLKVNVL